MAKIVQDANGNWVPAPKKPFYKRVWFIILAVLLGIRVLGNLISGGSDSEEKTSETPSSSQVASSETDVKTVKTTEAVETTEKKKKKENNEKALYAVGQTFTVGDVEYTVNSVSQTATVGDEYFNETANGVYLIVNITVKNNGKKALSVSDSFFKVYKGEVEFESDSGAAIYANEDTSFFLEEINPTLSLTSNVVFDVSPEMVSAPELQLQVQTGFWGTETARVKLN